MSSEEYTPIRQIGKGAFGTAHIVQHKVTGERFVLKRVRLARQNAKERQASVKELLLLSNLRHRNVLEFKGCWIEGGCNLCLLVELCESGDLLTQLKIRAPTGVHFTEEHLQEMAVQLLSAMDYLHRSSIVHRDIKQANILVTGEGCLKLADFGLSTVLDASSGGLTSTMVGTPSYMSPCVLQEKPYGAPNDIWGLGCVLYELSALKPAFQAFNMAGLIKKVTTGPPPPVPACYSDTWRNFIKSILSKEPSQRPTAAELLELDWLQPAIARVRARFGPELPPGAPDVLDRLSDLPPHIMGLFDTFLQQERDEKKRAAEAKAKRAAAVAQWDPMARAAQAAVAKQQKLPPLKPHEPRRPQPRPSRGLPPAGGPPPGCGAVRAAAEAAAPAEGRRKTYCGGGGGIGGNGRGRHGAVLRPSGVVDDARRRLAAWPSDDEDVASPRNNRPNSAPPDSPVRRTPRNSVGTVPAAAAGHGDGSSSGLAIRQSSFRVSLEAQHECDAISSGTSGGHAESSDSPGPSSPHSYPNALCSIRAASEGSALHGPASQPNGTPQAHGGESGALTVHQAPRPLSGRSSSGSGGGASANDSGNAHRPASGNARVPRLSGVIAATGGAAAKGIAGSTATHVAPASARLASATGRPPLSAEPRPRLVSAGRISGVLGTVPGIGATSRPSSARKVPALEVPANGVQGAAAAGPGSRPSSARQVPGTPRRPWN